MYILKIQAQNDDGDDGDGGDDEVPLRSTLD